MRRGGVDECGPGGGASWARFRAGSRTLRAPRSMFILPGRRCASRPALAAAVVQAPEAAVSPGRLRFKRAVTAKNAAAARAEGPASVARALHAPGRQRPERRGSRGGNSKSAASPLSRERGCGEGLSPDSNLREDPHPAPWPVRRTGVFRRPMAPLGETLLRFPRSRKGG
jgi:hypothetical protein